MISFATLNFASQGLGLLPAQAQGDPVAPVDAHFIELLDAYRTSGGQARCSEVAVRAVRKRPDGEAWLESCLSRRVMVSLDWHSGLWLPWFQFNRDYMALREEVPIICKALSGRMVDWEIAEWFIRPNEWLFGVTPVALLREDPLSVIEAAHSRRLLQCA